MAAQENSSKAILYGIVSSLFLSSTFIINSILAGTGGYWAWTAALRSLFLIPILGIAVLMLKQLKPLLSAIKKEPIIFIKWGIGGFGLLYTSLALASLISPGWMVAAVFQLNILAGILLAPFIYSDHRRQIPKRALCLSVFIIAGVFIMQFEKMSHLNSASSALLSFFIVLLGAIAWPLGNRKLLADLESKEVQLSAMQRVLGMTIGSLPLLLVLSVIGYTKSGLPSFPQCQSSLYSALLSGFIGGAGFYYAAQMVKKNTAALAAVEATQVFEILFTLAGEMLLKGTAMPGLYGIAGIAIVLCGMAFHYWNAVSQGRSAEIKFRRLQLVFVNRQQRI